MPRPPTALLVIDLQRGAFDGVRWSVIAEPERLLSNALRLIQAARQAGIPVWFIQHCEGPGEVFEEGSVQGQLHEALQPLPAEHLLTKRASSAFENTDLEAQLRALPVEQLVLCGLQSEFCVANTAQAARQLGFEVIVAGDAHGTWPAGGETAAAIAERVNTDLRAAGIHIQTTSDLVRSLA